MTKKPTVTWHAIDELKIDPRAQRALRGSFVRQIVQNYDAAMIGLPEVSVRDDGTKWIIDGQHRVAAMRQLGIPRVQCHTWYGLTRSDEAARFLGIQTKVNVRAIDKFLIRVTAGDPIASEIVDIITDAGYEIVDGHNDGSLNAVNALERVYTGTGVAPKGKYPDVLRRTLAVVTDAWGHSRDGVQGDILIGVGFVLHRNPDIDVANLAAKLSNYPGGPTSLLGAGRGLKGLRGGTLAHALAETIVDRYNVGRRTRRLPDWRRSK